MRERPILFSGAMVRAILAGTKTQTRRVMKPQPEPCPPDHPKPGHQWRSRLHQAMLHVEDEMQDREGGWHGLAASACPYGEPGDRLWVRETWAQASAGGAVTDSLFYAATPDRMRFLLKDMTTWRDDPASIAWSGRWRPSIHMPRWACRLVLEITDVRVERLQACSEADACAEGMGSPITRDCKVPKFAALWDEINGPGAWAENPWVWALTFRRVTP